MSKLKVKPRLYITAPRNYLLKETIKYNRYNEQIEKNEEKFNLKK